MPWRDPAQTPTARARALIEAARSRGDQKRLGAWLDAADDAALRAAVVEAGNARGAELPPDAAAWPGKRLLRRARGREEASRRQGTPIARDEAFTCAHCGLAVPPAGHTARDHCPRCLRSLHVDVVPGDRSAGCGGLMDPVGLLLRHGEPVIRYRCRRCGAHKQNRALTEGELPDDPRALARLSGEGRLD